MGNATSFQPGNTVRKGKPKTGGRPKGSQNVITRDVKEMIVQALTNAGGEAYLTRQAKENPKAFLALLGRVLPLQVSGSDGGPIKAAIEVVFVGSNKG